MKSWLKYTQFQSNNNNNGAVEKTNKQSTWDGNKIKQLVLNASLEWCCSKHCIDQSRRNREKNQNQKKGEHDEIQGEETIAVRVSVFVRENKRNRLTKCCYCLSFSLRLLTHGCELRSTNEPLWTALPFFMFAVYLSLSSSLSVATFRHHGFDVRVVRTTRPKKIHRNM